MFLIPRGSLGTAHCPPRTPLNNSTRTLLLVAAWLADLNVRHFVWRFGWFVADRAAHPPLLVSESSSVPEHGYQGEREAGPRGNQLCLSARHPHHHPKVPDVGGEWPLREECSVCLADLGDDLLLPDSVTKLKTHTEALHSCEPVSGGSEELLGLACPQCWGSSVTSFALLGPLARAQTRDASVEQG